MSRTRMYADHYLHAMGDLYVDARMADTGISFEQFLDGPDLVPMAEVRGKRRIEPMKHARMRSHQPDHVVMEVVS